MIRLSHSIFAMPFALAAAVFAAQEVPVSATQMVFIVLCMVFARSSAMGFNRIVDRDIDGANPRTQGREIPSGQISVRSAWGFTLLSAALFVVSAGMLNGLALALSPVALAVVWGYSLTKRYTALCHVVLGVGLALAPTGVWVGLTGSYSAVPLVLSIAVGTWVAGFDILYSCQDYEFDAQAGLHSVPVALGLPGAMAVSAGFHVITVVALAALPWFLPLGALYAVGVVIISAVLVYEHWIVSPRDLSRINKAFFDLNGYISLAFFAFVAADVWFLQSY